MAVEALEAIVAIERDMPYPYPPESTWRVGPDRSAPHSLGYGGAAIALFYCYLARTLNRPELNDLSFAFLRDAIEGMRSERMPHGFYKGQLGICWAHEHIHRKLNTSSLSLPISEQGKSAALDFCRSADAVAGLADGITGVALYAVNCLGGDRHDVIEIFVQRILELGDSFASGLNWPVPKPMRRQFPIGSEAMYSPCVSWGSAGVVGGLLTVMGSTIRETCLRQTIERAVAWILANGEAIPDLARYTSGSHHSPKQFFPFVHGAESKGWVATGWCSGDLGIVRVLFNAAQAMQNAVWMDLALKIARVEAERRIEDVEASSRGSYSLCHGASGRAHIFNRFFHSTQEAIFADAAQYWYRRTLALRKPGSGIGGFEEYGRTSQALLEGTSGLGLSLLAAISSHEPDWDEALLVSLPK